MTEKELRGQCLKKLQQGSEPKSKLTIKMSHNINPFQHSLQILISIQFLNHKIYLHYSKIMVYCATLILRVNKKLHDKSRDKIQGINSLRVHWQGGNRISFPLQVVLYQRSSLIIHLNQQSPSHGPTQSLSILLSCFIFLHSNLPI